tara:strand:- start:152 stop:451 length:300 start_codon:yes stop_codon:yes gene_type:complete
LIISLFIIGCVSDSSNHIHDLIPRDSFKNILIDIEKQQHRSNLDLDSLQHINQDSLLLTSILVNYNLSISTYEKTVLFYIDRPEEMLGLLHEVKDSLSF